MAGTVVAVFNDYEQAQKAGQALLDGGVPFADISLVRKGAGGEHGAPHDALTATDDDPENSTSHAKREVETHDVEQPFAHSREVGPRTAVGLVTGASLGAILVSASVFVPGIGALMAAGPLTAMLTGAVGDGAVGGLVGALTHDGMPEEAANRYHDHVSAGDTLVTVLAGESSERKIEQILEAEGGQEIGYFSRFIDTLQTVES